MIYSLLNWLDDESLPNRKTEVLLYSPKFSYSCRTCAHTLPIEIPNHSYRTHYSYEICLYNFPIFTCSVVTRRLLWTRCKYYSIHEYHSSMNFRCYATRVANIVLHTITHTTSFECFSKLLICTYYKSYNKQTFFINIYNKTYKTNTWII